MTLLHLVQLPRAGVGGAPLFIEVPVHAETAPYLVTAHKGPLWIERSTRGVVRTAMVRGSWKMDTPNRYRATVLAVMQRGLKDSWGNVFPSDGESEARAYLESLGHEDLELLTHDGEPRVGGVQHAKNTWIPEGCAVLVPRDRSYLGSVGVWDDSTYTLLLHNPSRGMAILGDW